MLLALSAERRETKRADYATTAAIGEVCGRGGCLLPTVYKNLVY